MTAKPDCSPDEPAKHTAKEGERGPEDAIVTSMGIELGHRDFAKPLEGYPELAAFSMAERIGGDPTFGEQFLAYYRVPKAARVTKKATRLGNGENEHD